VRIDETGETTTSTPESRRRNGGDVEAFRGTEFLAVQPFSDDHPLLESIGATPEQCSAVDAYWKIYGDVIFLQVSTAAHFSGMQVGTHARWSGRDGHVNLHVVVDSATITRAIFEAEMSRLIDRGMAGRALGRGRGLGETLTPI
jgi:hypothetical protein